ncbi:hydrogenase maturation nickel metallochaperone HypA [Dehalobacter sp. DCM]|uniref:hydrogenase maturation nickel metallochaperone HypA/HybF n=1 Tax=Dehalobacter sp. DCM TaxID=2907827 RepID=UPI00308175B8|nr:hydrogenase maturation nickel metallochaperone HypA [Dehalobacter sp. DCM]
MHEYGVVRQIINIVSEKALQANAKSVEEITVVVGELTGYVGESLQRYFGYFTENTLCANAELIIEKVPAQWECSNCHKNFIISSAGSFACPVCGRDGKPTEIGREFYIKSTRISVKSRQ